MDKQRRALTTAIAAAASALTFPINVVFASGTEDKDASKYPSRPVRIVVGFAAGASTDMIARYVAEILAKELGGTFFVENRAGAGGNIAAVAVKNSEPNGYTFLLAIAAHVTNRGLYKALPYEPIKDFSPVSLVAQIPFILVANPSFPGNTLADVIRIGKEKPGNLDYATAGVGSSQHLSGEQFSELTGTKWNHIPYNGGAPALVAVASGEVPLAFLTTQLVAPMVKKGTLKPIAIASTQRSPLLPDVPTFTEAGMSGFTAGTWYGLLAPAGTPNGIIERIHAALGKGLTDKGMLEKFTAQDAFIINGSPSEFAKQMREDDAKWLEIIQRAGIKAQ